MKKIFLLVLLCGGFSFAQNSSTSMSGYTAKQFGDFAKDWHLVTVRFRKDTGEMRLTYANDIAWKTMKNGGAEYPDGAVFAKLGAMTKEDPAFPSSAVPSGTRRMQFMVKDKKKHADTEGWGYALFDMEGKTFPGDLKQAALACAACHRIVPQRDYVFSQPFTFSAAVAEGDLDWQKHLKFIEVAVQRLPSKVKAVLPKGTQVVHQLEGDMAQFVFAGTLDEIRPLLAREASKTSRATVFVSTNKESFSVVFPIPGGKCAAKEVFLKGMHTLPAGKFFEVEFCQGEAP